MAQHGKDKRVVIAAVSNYCRARSIPVPDRNAYAIVAQQVGNLLNGGYDLRDIHEVALDLAAEFTLATYHTHLSRLQLTVQQRYQDRNQVEHDAVKEASRVVAPDVLAAMGAPLHAFTGAHSDYDPTWRRRCATDGCTRTALWSLTRCGAHEPT